MAGRTVSRGSDATARKTRFAAAVVRQRFRVPFAYPVVFTRNLFHPRNPVLESALVSDRQTGPARVLAFVDDGVARAHPGLPDRIAACLAARPRAARLVATPETLPGGETVKRNWNAVQHVMTQIGAHHLCRHSYVIAVGGGSFLDMVGFAASLVHRGLRLVRAPTTVLAQNDAGIGVKNGMNEHGVKNFVGTFAPPHAVLVDFDFLRTLSRKDWIGGIAEAFKVALIRDARFFDYLRRHAARLRARDDKSMETLVRRCACHHLAHIRTSGDPFEMGAARPLDFGHWSAHKLESLSRFTMGHGQAVAVGIALDASYAAGVGLLAEDERDRILAALEAVGLPTWSPLLETKSSDGEPEILRGLEDFREHLGGRLTVTLPRGIGRKIEVHEMDTERILRCIRWLKQRRRVPSRPD